MYLLKKPLIQNSGYFGCRVVDCGKISGSIPFSDMAIVLSKSNIKNPMQAVLNLPMTSNVLGYLFCVVCP